MKEEVDLFDILLQNYDFVNISGFLQTRMSLKILSSEDHLAKDSTGKGLLGFCK